MTITILLITLMVLLPSSFQLPAIALPIGSFYITLFEVIFFVLVLVWIMRVSFSGRSKRERFLFRKYVISLFSLYAVYIIVGLFQRDPTMVLADFRQYMPLMLYFPFLYSLRTQELLEKLRRALFVSLIVISFYIIVIFTFLNGPLMAYAVKYNTGFTGERIFIDNSIFLFNIYLGYVTAALFAGQLRFSRRLFYLAIISLGLLVLAVMQMRTLWVMAGLILIFTIFSLEGVVYKFKYVAISSISILITIIMIILTLKVTDYRSRTIDSLNDRFASFSDLRKVGQQTAKKTESIGSVETRLATAEYAMKNYILPNWLFGLGFGGQIQMVNILGAKGLMKYQIDNGFLTLLLKFGVFGMLFYLFFTLKIITSLFGIIFNPRAGKEDVWLAKSFLCAIVAMAAGSFFTSIFIREQVCVVSFVVMLCEIELINKRLTGHNTEKVQSHV